MAPKDAVADELMRYAWTCHPLATNMFKLLKNNSFISQKLWCCCCFVCGSTGSCSWYERTGNGDHASELGECQKWRCTMSNLRWYIMWQVMFSRLIVWAAFTVCGVGLVVICWSLKKPLYSNKGRGAFNGGFVVQRQYFFQLVFKILYCELTMCVYLVAGWMQWV